MEFVGFPKMPRLSREMIITEKLDGTNASVLIKRIDELFNPGGRVIFQNDEFALYSSSRTRWITPDDDNYGFSRWCMKNAESLLELGEGHHFGEWWGQGIQRGYGLKEKRFSLFNNTRWTDAQPECCDVVPEIYRGDFNTLIVELELDRLRTNGSYAAEGFMKPEGVVVFHTAANMGFKKTLVKDEQPKSISGV